MKKKKTAKRAEKPKINPSDPLYRLAFEIKPGKGDQRRVAVLEATLTCLSKRGIEATNFETIGKEAGMLRAHVAYYFPNLDALIEAAIKFVIANAQRITVENVMRATTPRERLTTFIESAFDWAERYPSHLPVLLQLYSYCATRKPYRTMHTEIRLMGADRLKAIIESDLMTSGKKPDRALELALTIQDLITGSILTLTTTEPKFPLSDAKFRVVQTALALLDK